MRLIYFSPVFARSYVQRPHFTVQAWLELGVESVLRVNAYPAGLPPNVHLFPPCEQTETAGHLARCSAGLIPFLRNTLTVGVAPIKFYEYRAAGLPVLNTTFGEMALRGPHDGVCFLDRADDLQSVVTEALSRQSSRTEIERFRRDHNWQQRFRQTNPFRPLLSAHTLSPRTPSPHTLSPAA